VDSRVDTDRDGVSDLTEVTLGTDPTQIDSDRDGLSDHYELWGALGNPVGTEGLQPACPDPNQNGVIAALDPRDAGLQTLSPKELSAVGTSRMLVPVFTAQAVPTATDPDGDLIPSSFELAGFYVEYDQADESLYFVKWDGQDLSKNYYKTDPLKWSTDADPWSDYEEATKINLDQRIKAPGDHPLVPAYPDLQVLLRNFTWEQNADITDQNGETATSSFSETGESYWSVSAKVSREATAGGPEVAAVKWGVEVTGEGGHKWSDTTTNGSEISWTTTTASNTIQTAKLTLNISLFNLGTLPASNPRVVCRLKLGGFAIRDFVLNYTGDLPALSPEPVDFAVTNDGQATPIDLFLSLNQLRSLMTGAPLTISVVGFEADTLVSEVDPSTGRRLNLNVGKWSPYAAAIQNNTARLVVDLNTLEIPQAADPRVPPRRFVDTRVFAFAPDGGYFGSPPVVTLLDGLHWACNARNALGDTFITIKDAFTGEPYTASLRDWTVALYPDDYALVSKTPALQDDILQLPLRPSNPHERTYVARAPAVPGEFSTDVNWATAFAGQRLVYAAITNLHSDVDATLIPYPGAAGLPMEMPFADSAAESALFSLLLPQGYFWTGYEQISVVDAGGNQMLQPVELWRGETLGQSAPPGGPQFEEVIEVQEGGLHDIDEALDPEAAIPDLVCHRISPAEIRIDAINGARMSGPLSRSNNDGWLTYEVLRKQDYPFDSTSSTSFAVLSSDGTIALILVHPFLPGPGAPAVTFSQKAYRGL
jgi:hypothetical protein